MPSLLAQLALPGLLAQLTMMVLLQMRALLVQAQLQMLLPASVAVAAVHTLKPMLLGGHHKRSAHHSQCNSRSRSSATATAAASAVALERAAPGNHAASTSMQHATICKEQVASTPSG